MSEPLICGWCHDGKHDACVGSGCDCECVPAPHSEDRFEPTNIHCVLCDTPVSKDDLTAYVHKRCAFRKEVTEAVRTKDIRTDSEHAAALARIDAIMDAEPGTPESDELDVLVDQVRLYERGEDRIEECMRELGNALADAVVARPILQRLYDDGAEERLIDGVAAVMYVTEAPGFWWHLVREEVREKWRASARAAIAAGEIHG